MYVLYPELIHPSIILLSTLFLKFILLDKEFTLRQQEYRQENLKLIFCCKLS
jgi:hypothetical protein